MQVFLTLENEKTVLYVIYIKKKIILFVCNRVEWNRVDGQIKRKKKDEEGRPKALNGKKLLFSF